ncbi:hypothetical protein AB0E27_20255 [Streptomyces sparsogenes]|uniref:hypothetical protein n=1 Tax=Streptomyces sparsogenes TaxID=67365 RepID=UPI0033F004D0
MPKLPKHQLPEVKLDSAAASIEGALTAEQRRGLFENPGMVVVAIVELSSKSYTGHADGEEKDPQVKLRVTGCEVARSDDEAAALLEAKRAMWRARRMDGTLDEIGNGPRNAENLLDAAFAGYPSEAEYRAQEAEKSARARTEYVR